MGAFLSEPVTDKVSADQEHQRLSFGVCSMQGWRFTQEDNHSCFPALDEACSLFGVYDGHGGAEVSRYVASLLPDYVLARESWKEGDVGKALSEAFLALDYHLGSKRGLKVLKKLAAEDDAALDQEKDRNKSSADDDGESEDGSEENVRNLFKEAKMPLEMLMAKYGQALAASRNAAESQGDSVGSPSASKSGKATKSKEEEEDAEEDDEDDKKKESGKKGEAEGDDDEGNVKEKAKAEKMEVEDDKKEKTSEGEKKEDGGGSSGGSKDSEVREEGSGEGAKAPKEEPKENGLPDEDDEKPTKNGSGGCTKLRSRKNRIVMTDDNDDDDDSSDEEYDENSSSLVDEEEEDGDEEEESSSGDDDEEVWIPKSDEFALKMLQGPGLDSGCTAVVAVLKEGGVLYVANAGDSRCILSRKGVAVDMSVDHKPEDEEESKRIKEAGGEVTCEGRVNGGLNLSRALGDHAYKQGKCGARKQMISALPDVRRIHLREDEDEFMVLACDGIWNSMTSQNVVDFVRERLFKGLPKGDKTKSAKEMRKMAEGVKLSKICGKMFNYCLAPNTSGDGTGCDNMTAILVTFKEDLWTKKDGEEKPEEKKDSVKSEETEEKAKPSAEEGKTEEKECDDGKDEGDGIVLLTPPPSPKYVLTEEDEEVESSAEEEEEILEDEEGDEEEEGEAKSDDASEEEVVIKNKGVGKGCKRLSKEGESPMKVKKQKLDDEEEDKTS